MSIIDAKWDGRTTFRVREAAEILSMTTWCCYEAIKQGQVPAIRIGKRVIVPRAALEQMLAGAMQQPGGAT
jgi:excisionase family DNA binding protein